MDASNTKGGEVVEGKLQQRAGGDDMELRQVFLEEAEAHDGFLAGLYLINEEQCLSFFDLLAAQSRYLGNNTMDIAVGLEKLCIRWLLLKVDLHKAAELLTEMADSC